MIHRVATLFLCLPLLIFSTVNAQTDETIVFAEVTERAGLVAPLQGMMGHGAAAGDFDGDGKVDIFVGGFCDRPNEEYAPVNHPVPNRLLRNLGDGKFELVQQNAVSGLGRMSGAVFADLDNSGSLDLYVANNAKPRTRKNTEPQHSAQLQHALLFKNENGELIDVSGQSNACPNDLYTARNVGVLDFDQDGLLDLLVVEDMFRRNSHSHLFRNLGEMRFEDATEKAGIPLDVFGLGLAIADLNDDRHPDFFVGHSNRMFISNGDGTYREPAELRKTFEWSPLNNEDWPCGAAFGDLNGDGRLDLALSIHGQRARNKVYLNLGWKNGDPAFEDVTEKVGMETAIPNKCPHVEIQDFDNDGRPDIYFSAAWLDGDKVTPLIFRNKAGEAGLPKFVPPREIAGEMIYFPAGPTLDFDDDGQLDLFLVNWFQGNHCRLMQNKSPRKNWLKVKITGREFNRMGIGSKISVYRQDAESDDDLLGTQQVSTGYGYASGQIAECHFGLGEYKKVRIRIVFPNGNVKELENVTANQRLVVAEE